LIFRGESPARQGVQRLKADISAVDAKLAQEKFALTPGRLSSSEEKEKRRGCRPTKGKDFAERLERDGRGSPDAHGERRNHEIAIRRVTLIQVDNRERVGVIDSKPFHD